MVRSKTNARRQRSNYPAVIATLLAVAVFCVPATVFAQQPPTQPQQPEEGTAIAPSLLFADLKLGPVFLQPRINIRDFGYDSNVFGRTPSSDDTWDIRFTLSPGTKLAIPIRENHMITGDAQLDYMWFARTPEFRAFNPILSVKYEYSSSRWELEARTRYYSAKRTQVDILEVDDTVLPGDPAIFSRIRETRLDVGGTARWNLTNRTFLEGRGDRRIIRYDEPELSIPLDRTEERLGGSLGYRLTSRSSTSLVVNWQSDDYENPGNIRDAESYTAAAQIDIDASAPLSGSVTVGYKDQAPREPDVIGFDGVVANGRLTMSPGGVARVDLSGERNSYPALWGQSIFFVRQGGQLSVLFRTTSSIGVGADLGIYEHRYPSEEDLDVGDAQIPTRRLDRITQATGRLQLRTAATGLLEIRIGYINRDSNFPELDTDGLIISSGYGVVF